MGPGEDGREAVTPVRPAVSGRRLMAGVALGLPDGQRGETEPEGREGEAQEEGLGAQAVPGGDGASGQGGEDTAP